MGYNFSKNLFIGEVNDSFFKITLGVNSLTTTLFPPFIRGVITKEKDITQIEISIKPRFIDQIAIAFCVFLALFVCLGKVFVGYLFIPLILYLMLLIAFNYFSRKSKTILSERLGLKLI